MVLSNVVLVTWKRYASVHNHKFMTLENFASPRTTKIYRYANNSPSDLSFRKSKKLNNYVCLSFIFVVKTFASEHYMLLINMIQHIGGAIPRASIFILFKRDKKFNGGDNDLAC